MIVDAIGDGKTAADFSGMTIHMSHGHILNVKKNLPLTLGVTCFCCAMHVIDLHNSSSF